MGIIIFFLFVKNNKDRFRLRTMLNFLLSFKSKLLKFT